MNGVIYARYSSDNQREESIEGQLRECKEFAKHNDITIVDSYIDRAFSAKTDNRPSFQKMIRDSAKGQFDAIIVWKLDRFARNRYDSAHYKAQLARTVLRLYLQQKQSVRALKVSFLNLFLRVWLNITLPNLPKKLSVDKLKML